MNWDLHHIECWRIDAFALWCWRRPFRVLWAASKLNQSILKEINPEYSLERLRLKLELQYLGTWCEEPIHWKRPWCWERLRAGEGADRGWDDRRWDEVWPKLPHLMFECVGWHHRLNGHKFEQTLDNSKGQRSLVCCSPWGCKELDTSWRLNNDKVYPGIKNYVITDSGSHSS